MLFTNYVFHSECKNFHIRNTLIKSTGKYYRAIENVINTSNLRPMLLQIITGIQARDTFEIINSKINLQLLENKNGKIFSKISNFS